MKYKKKLKMAMTKPPSYDAWRISFQSPEQAAQSAYLEMMQLREIVAQLQTPIDPVESGLVPALAADKKGFD